MNDKFWDLKKAKQDNMINGALKIFSINGFRHASTDEIVAEATISKGLLFHYFYSKAGLYEFLTEYSARFALVELNSELRRNETLPFFDFQRSLTKAEARVMRQYPYLTLFLERAAKDREADSYEQAVYNTALYTERLADLLDKTVFPDPMTHEDASRINGLLHLSRIDKASTLLRDGNFSPERYEAEMTEIIHFLDKLY